MSQGNLARQEQNYLLAASDPSAPEANLTISLPSKALLDAPDAHC